MRTRRQFIRDSWKWSGLLFIPKLIRAQPVFPPAFWGPAPASGGGGGCGTTLVEQNGYNGGNPTLDEKFFGFNFGDHYLATYFVASANETICNMELHLKAVGSPTFPIKAAIWNYDVGGDVPTTQIGTASDEINSASISTSAYSYVSCPNMSATLVAGTAYCVVGFMSAGTTDFTNYLLWDSAEIDPLSHHTIWRGNDGVTWTSIGISNLEILKFKSYK